MFFSIIFIIFIITVNPRRQKSIEIKFHLHIGPSREQVQLAELRLRLAQLEGHRIRRGATVAVYKGTKLQGLIKYRLAEGVDAGKDYTPLDITRSVKHVLSLKI